MRERTTIDRKAILLLLMAIYLPWMATHLATSRPWFRKATVPPRNSKTVPRTMAHRYETDLEETLVAQELATSSIDG